LKKGDPSNIKTFCDVYKSEAIATAYLHFRDISDFKKFRFFYPTLKWYIFWRNNCNRRSSNKALELLRDFTVMEGKDSREETFPATEEGILAKYPQDESVNQSDKSMHKHYVYAAMLFRYAQEIEATKSVPLEQQAAQQQLYESNFTALHAENGYIIPKFEISGIRYPSLGPHQALEEDELEKFNRANTLIRSLDAICNSKWVEKFGPNVNQPYISSLIDQSHFPKYMLALFQTGTKVQSASAAVANPKEPELIAKPFTLSWKQKKMSPALVEHLEELDTQGFTPPPGDVVAVRDPRVYSTGEEWRDTLRNQLDFRKLRIDFLTMHVVVPDQQKVMWYSFNQPYKATPWQDVRGTLEKEGVQFEYTIRSLEDEEEFGFEYTGVPLAFEGDFIDDPETGLGLHPNIVSAVTEIDNRATETKSSPHEQSRDAETDAFLEGIGPDQSGWRLPDPKKDWPPERYEEMLRDHSGHNVLTPEGLRSWQLETINAVCGTPAKPKPIAGVERKASLRNFASDSEIKEMEEQLGQGQQYALSVDVRYPS
jgi:hypothetical protein